MMKTIETVYLAGKMQDDDWRYPLFDQHDTSHSHSYQEGCNPLTVARAEDWPEEGREEVFGLRYVGPFFVDTMGGHGYSSDGEKHTHGANVRSRDGAMLYVQRILVQAQCFDAIQRADLVFAWIDGTDCYGTIAEIGYAKALGKTVWIAGPKKFDDLWFVYQMAGERCFIFPKPEGALGEMLLACDANIPHFNSPIERKFWMDWIARVGREFLLTPQHPIGKYRADFAHLPTETVIELDGFASHSSTEDIANDRKRQRYIESQGWHVIRFGGKEVHHDVTGCVNEVYQLIGERLKIKAGNRS